MSRRRHIVGSCRFCGFELIRGLIEMTPAGTRIALEHAPHHTEEMHGLLRDATTLRDARCDERVTVGVVPDA